MSCKLTPLLQDYCSFAGTLSLLPLSGKYQTAIFQEILLANANAARITLKKDVLELIPESPHLPGIKNHAQQLVDGTTELLESLSHLLEKKEEIPPDLPAIIKSAYLSLIELIVLSAHSINHTTHQT